MDAFDLLVIVGILFIGVAVWLGLGWPGLLGLVGLVLVGLGWLGEARGGKGR